MNKSKTSSQKIGRDACTGKFISVKEARRRPSTTVVETIKHTVSRKTIIGRDSIAGTFLNLKEAQRRPSTAVISAITCDSKKSLEFLQNAGILTPTGRLSSKYKK